MPSERATRRKGKAEIVPFHEAFSCVAFGLPFVHRRAARTVINAELWFLFFLVIE